MGLASFNRKRRELNAKRSPEEINTEGQKVEEKQDKTLVEPKQKSKKEVKTPKKKKK